MADCICIEAPDAVDRINWKCVLCKRVLESDCEAKWAAKRAEQEAAILERNTPKPGELTDAEIADRRAMAEGS